MKLYVFGNEVSPKSLDFQVQSRWCTGKAVRLLNSVSSSFPTGNYVMSTCVLVIFLWLSISA